MGIFVLCDFPRKILLLITTLFTRIFTCDYFSRQYNAYDQFRKKNMRDTREKYSNLTLSHVTYANTGKDLCIRSTDNNFYAKMIKYNIYHTMNPFCF